MPNFCAVFNCASRGNQDKKSYYRIPSIPKNGTEERKKLTETRRKKWIAALKRDDITEDKIQNMRICEDHFISGKPSTLMESDHPDWVPSKNMGYGTNSDSESSLNRFDGRKKRILHDYDEFSSIEASNLTSEVENITFIDATGSRMASVIVQTDLTMKEMDEKNAELQDLQTRMIETDRVNAVFQDLQTQLIKTKNDLKKMTLDEESLKNNDEKVKYYTAIPNFITLSIIFNPLKTYISETHLTSLTKFQKFLLTLMHLRLNLDFTDLSYRFGISKPTASRIFSECLHVLHERLFDLVFWPEREELTAKVPLTFLETFGRKVTVIIDCFEIKIEKPGNLMASAQCYSHYKHHHTMKYLIGISPQGAIIFISSAWGGSTSDKHIVQNSGFLEKLLPGDLVLADRGFNVKDEVGLYCAELKIPAFTRGKKQLDAVDVEATRNIAHVRIHVERVIGQLRQTFRILSDVMPLTMVKKANAHSHSTVDQVVRVCCALVNFMPSVIPME